MAGVAGVPGDYAANIGTTGADYTLTSQFGDVPPNGAYRAFKGLGPKEFTDGMSNTILIGEKHVPKDKFMKFPWDCGIFDGHNPICNTRCGGPGYPVATTREDLGWKFGSYHPGLCQFVFCDGSVHTVTSHIPEVTLGLLCQRNDGQRTPSYDD
jgi:prepilin-type processing-associated H-X9-DG protein